MRRLALLAAMLMLALPAVAAAQSEAVARDGSAYYSNVRVMLGTAEAPHHLLIAFKAQCRDIRGAELAVSPEAREAVIRLLRGQNAADLATPEGKERLKAALVDTLNRVIGSPRVVRVLFLQFLIV